MADLKLQLLGGIHLTDSDGRDLGLTARKARALLAYVAMQEGKPVPRDRLAGLLWEEGDDSQARTNLRQTLTTIRRALPDAAREGLVADTRSIAINPEILEVDVSILLSLEDEKDPKMLHEAIDLFSGDLLEGVNVRSHGFEEWLASERYRIRSIVTEMMLRLVEIYSDGGDIDKAVSVSSRVLLFDPLREATHRQLMSLYAAAGQLSLAVRQYRTCQKLLREELGVTPDADTQALYEEIQKERRKGRGADTPGTEDAAPVRPDTQKADIDADHTLPQAVILDYPGPSKVELLERDESLKVMKAVWDEAVDGHGSIIAISGEAGIGKTSLVARFVDLNRDAARILWGACDALMTPEPLSPLHDIARQVHGGLGALLEPGRSRVSVFTDILTEFLDDERPTVVVIEDIHWADDATLDLLRYLGRRIGQTRLIVLVTCRDEEIGRSHPVRRVFGELPQSNLRRINLDPLTPGAVERLAREHGRKSTGLYNATGGNPFFVTEVLASINEAIPPSVRDAVLARVARLEGAAQAVLEMVSVVPGRMEHWLFDVLISRDEMAGLDVAIEAGLLVPGLDATYFRHEIARQAVSESLPFHRLRALHARVLDILTGRSGVSVARLVHHADKSGNVEATLILAVRAAEEASRMGSHREAAAHYETALGHAGGQSLADQATLLNLCSYERLIVGEVPSAIDACTEALALWRREANALREGDTLRWLSRLHWLDGRRPDAESASDRAVEILEGQPEGQEIAWAYSNRAQLHMLAHEPDAAVEWGSKAIAIAERLAADEIRVHALNNVGVARAIKGEPQGWTDLEESLRVSLENNYQDHAARAYTNIGSYAVIVRDYKKAEHYLTEGLAYCMDRDLEVDYSSGWLAEMYVETGRWAEAIAQAQRVLSHDVGSRLMRFPSLIALARVRVRRGDEGVDALFKEAARLPEEGGEAERIAPLAAVRAEAAWLRGDNKTARQYLAEAWARPEIQASTCFKSEIAYWLWRTGGLDEPYEDADEPVRLHLEGKWREAAAAWRELGAVYEEALALTDGDEAARQRGLAKLDELGARPAIARIEEDLATRTAQSGEIVRLDFASSKGRKR